MIVVISDRSGLSVFRVVVIVVSVVPLALVRLVDIGIVHICVPALMACNNRHQ